MRSSLILAAHNEGDLLWRTLESVVQTSLGLQFEIVVADDASWDGCVAEAQRRFPEIRLVRHDERRGASPTKDLGARHARGDVLIFIDSHVKPESGALKRLVEDVELCHGEAMIVPAIGRLDPDQWRITDREHLGHGYWMDLETLDCRWLSLAQLREHPRRGRLFYETPALIGCAFAIHRDLYEKLRGFDPHMFCWGAEDLDLGLKGWLLGHPVLHDPQAVIGHRFQQKFENFQVPVEQLIANQLRLARKNFTESVWADWADRCRRRYPGKLTDHPEGLWARAWSLYTQWQASVEYERSYLQARRVRDEFWYADRFGMNWPRLQVADAFTEPPTTAPLTVAAESVSQPEPVPSPSDFSHWLDAIDDTYTIDGETGQAAGNVITSENSDDGLGNDTYDGIPIVDPSNYTTTLIEAPKHGQVTLDEHGNFIYIPDDGSTEPDSFTYELSAPGGLTDQATVNVLGLANNDHEPKFDGPYTVEIPEDTAVDTVVITVVATDADADLLAYSIIGGNDDGTFAIDETTGEIRLRFGLDYESASSYTLTVKAMDIAGLSATTNVHVTVTDVDEPPEVPEMSFAVNHGDVSGTFVGTITAFDPEGDAISSYTILDQKGTNGGGVEQTVNSFFRIAKDPGSDAASIYVADGITIDYNEFQSFRINVQAYVVGGQFGTAWSTIRVNQAANTPPFITSIQLEDLPEDSQLGTIAATVQAYDNEDGPGVTYTLNPDFDPGPFVIDVWTGRIQLNGPLDYATTPSYELHVRVFDSQLAFVDTTLVINVFAAVGEQRKPYVGMVADTHAVERPPGDPDYFRLTFYRRLNPGLPLLPGIPLPAMQLKFAVKFQTLNDDRFDAVNWDDLEATDIPGHGEDLNILKQGFYDFPAFTIGDTTVGEQRVDLYIKAKDDGVTEPRPQQFFVEILPDPTYIPIVRETQFALLNRIYAYPSAYFTIYEGIVIAVRPDGATDDEPAAVDQSDLAQRVHDCYCIAALIAAARAKPSQIEEMIEPLGNGSFRVNFADAPAQTIQLELDRGRDMVDLGPADADEMGNVEVWAVIMERAVAQMRQSEEGGGALFDALAGGDSGALYKKMTGRKAIPLDPQKWQVKSPDIALARARDINRWIRAGINVAGAKPQVMLSTLDTGNTNDRIPPGLLFDHVYVVRWVDMRNKVLHLIDPLRPSDDIETSFGWLGAMKDGKSKYLKYGYHCE